MKRLYGRPVIALALGLSVPLAVAEVGLRVGGFSNPRISQRDDFCGTIRRPSVVVSRSQEGGVPAFFNSAGFRDEEWTVAKPADTFRIAVLGASYVEAAPTELGKRFTEVLERILNRSDAVGGKHVDVMTFGLAGWGTAQELMCLRHYVWRYSPDMVILTFTTTDLRRNSKTLENDNGRPYFVYVNGNLILDASFRESPEHQRSWRDDFAFAVIDRFRTAQLAYRAWQARATAVKRASIGEAAQAVRTGDEIGLDSWVYSEPTHPVREEAWRVTEGLFALMNQEVRERGAEFLVVTLSNGVQVHPDSSVRKSYMQRLGVKDLFYSERRIAAAGYRDGFAVLNLAPLLLEHVRSSGVFLHGFPKTLGRGHWNDDGHREVGRLVAEEVRQILGDAGDGASVRAAIEAGSM